MTPATVTDSDYIGGTGIKLYWNKVANEERISGGKAKLLFGHGDVTFPAASDVVVVVVLGTIWSTVRAP